MNTNTKKTVLTLLTIVTLALTARALCLASDVREAEQLAAGPSASAGGSCVCAAPKYVRSSGNITLAGDEDYVELDSDAGLPITVTLPAGPAKNSRHEIWLGPQPGLPGGIVTIDPNGQPTYGSGLVLDTAMEGVVLLYVKPTPAGGGYWRVSEL